MARNVESGHLRWKNRPLTVFHGTDIDSARNIFHGEKLNAAIAAAKKIDGPPGFFLATEISDAEFFALRRTSGGVIEFNFSVKVVKQLKSAGAILQPIPPGKTVRFVGNEVVIPADVFETFNKLRETGEITMRPR